MFQREKSSEDIVTALWSIGTSKKNCYNTREVRDPSVCLPTYALALGITQKCFLCEINRIGKVVVACGVDGAQQKEKESELNLLGKCRFELGTWRHEHVQTCWDVVSGAM